MHYCTRNKKDRCDKLKHKGCYLFTRATRRLRNKRAFEENRFQKFLGKTIQRPKNENMGLIKNKGSVK